MCRKERLSVALGVAVSIISLFLCAWQVQRGLARLALLELKITPKATKLSQIPPNAIMPYTYAMFDIPIDNKHLFIQPNVIQNKTSGFQVYALAKPPSLTTHILVNLGWVEDKKRLNHLTQYPPGNVIFIKPSGFLLSLKKTPSTWPKEINHVDLKEIAHESEKKVFPLIALSERSVSYKQLHNQENTINALARHLSYSVQFFLLALVSGILTYRWNNSNAKKH